MLILQNNSIDRINIDDAILNNLNAGYETGVVKSYNNFDIIKASSNVIAIDTGILLIYGCPVKNEAIESITFNNLPTTAEQYKLIATLELLENVYTFSISYVSYDTALIKEDLYVTGSGKYQKELATFTLTASGVEDLIKTIDILVNRTSDNDGLTIGHVVTKETTIGTDAVVDIENRLDEETGIVYTDFTFGLPLKNAVDTESEQTISGKKNFEYAMLKMQQVTGSTAYKNLLMSPFGSTDVKRNLLAVNGYDQIYTAIHDNCYMEAGKLHSDSKEVATTDMTYAKVYTTSDELTTIGFSFPCTTLEFFDYCRQYLGINGIIQLTMAEGIISDLPSEINVYSEAQLDVMQSKANTFNATLTKVNTNRGVWYLQYTTSSGVAATATWAKIMDISSEQTVTGLKTFAYQTLKGTNYAGDTRLIPLSPTIDDTSTKLYLSGYWTGNASTGELNSNVYMQDGKIYSNSKETATTKIYETLSDLLGSDATQQLTIAEVVNEMDNNSILFATKTTGEYILVDNATGVPNTWGQIKIEKSASYRATLEFSYYSSTLGQVLYTAIMNESNFSGWQEVLNTSKPQTITGNKFFNYGTLKMQILSGSTDYRTPLTTPSSTTTAKRYIPGVYSYGATYSNYHTGVYFEDGKIYSDSKEVSTIPELIESSDTAVTINISPNQIINLTGALTSLTITEASSSYTQETIIYFTTGTSTTFTYPTTAKWIGRQPESLVANTQYVLSIQNNFYVIGEQV